MPAVTPTITRSSRRIGILAAPSTHDAGETDRGVGLLRPFGGLLGALGVRPQRRLALDYLVVRPLVSALFASTTHVAAEVRRVPGSDDDRAVEFRSGGPTGSPAASGLRTHTRIDTRILTSRHSTRVFAGLRPALQTAVPSPRTGTVPAVDGPTTAVVERHESSVTLSPDEAGRQDPSGPEERRPTTPGERDATDRGDVPSPTVLSRPALVHAPVDQWRVTRHTGHRSRVLEQTKTRLHTRTRRRRSDRAPARRQVTDPTPGRGDDAPQSPPAETGAVARPVDATDPPRLTYATPQAAPPESGDASDPRTQSADAPDRERQRATSATRPAPGDDAPKRQAFPTGDADLDRLADRVYDRFERKLRIERERRGLA